MVTGDLSLGFIDSSSFEATASLFNEVFSKESKASDFEWKYRKDLFGRLYGVQAKDREGKVVAHVATVPLEGMFGGDKIPFFQFVDAMVHPLWRGRNTLTTMIHTLLKLIRDHHSAFFPYVFPGPISSMIGQRYGWLRILKKSVEDIVISRPRKVNFTRRMRFISFEKFNPKCSTDVVDSLWRSLYGYFPICIIRDSSFLIWRYVSHPWFSYDFYIVKRLWKPVGWIVLETNHSSPPRIIDYLMSPFVMNEVFSCFFSELKTEEVTVWIPDFLKRFIFNLGELHPTPIDLALVVDDFTSSLALSETVSACFFYNMGDIDIY